VSTAQRELEIQEHLSDVLIIRTAQMISAAADEGSEGAQGILCEIVVDIAQMIRLIGQRRSVQNTDDIAESHGNLAKLLSKTRGRVNRHTIKKDPAIAESFVDYSS